MEKDLTKSTLNILLEIDGKVYLVGMTKDELEMYTDLIKRSIKVVIPTGKTQTELSDFLNYKK